MHISCCIVQGRVAHHLIPIGIHVDHQESLEQLLRLHSEKIIDERREYKLSVDRSSSDTLWQAVVCFYKGAKVKPQKPQWELVIDFLGTGEVGIDSGALWKKFLESAIVQANQRLFEGEADRCVVKKDWGLELMYEVAGPLVAHSFLQEGPGIPCLSPSMFDYLAKETDQCYPVVEDIPLNISTHDLITFIEQVSSNCCCFLHVKFMCSIIIAVLVSNLY